MDSVNIVNEKKYHHGNLREALLGSAIHLLDESGPDAVGIRQIAKHVGVAHSAPANHFKNKQALMDAIFERLVADFVAKVKAQLNPESANNIKDLAEIVLTYGLEYPFRYRLIWQSERPLAAAMDELYGLLTDMLQPFAAAKIVDVESQAIALWSMIHGYVSLRLDGHLSAGTDDVKGASRPIAIIDVLLAGIQ